MTASPPLDRMDRKILALLQAEGRITNHGLADRVGLSASACLARTRRLEALGVIEGYHARLSPYALGPTLILFAEVTLGDHNARVLARFEAEIAQMPEVVEVSQVSGAFDYLLKVVVPDMPAWTALTEELSRRDLAVDKIVTHVLMKKPKVFTGYPIGTD